MAAEKIEICGGLWKHYERHLERTKEHIELRTGKANRFLHQIQRNTSNLTVATELNLYHITLVPKSTYGFNCYLIFNPGIRLLEKFQKRVEVENTESYLLRKTRILEIFTSQLSVCLNRSFLLPIVVIYLRNGNPYIF